MAREVANLKWSHELPTESGWYWYRSYPKSRPEILFIDDHLMQNGWSVKYCYNEGKAAWAGPIELPMDNDL